MDIPSQRKEDRNGCAALNVANDAMRNVRANVKTRLRSPAVTALYDFLSKFSFQFGQTCCYFSMFSIQIILLFLYYKASLIFSFPCILIPLYYIFTLLQWKLFQNAWKFGLVTFVTINITSEVSLEVCVIGDT